MRGEKNQATRPVIIKKSTTPVLLKISTEEGWLINHGEVFFIMEKNFKKIIGRCVTKKDWLHAAKKATNEILPLSKRERVVAETFAKFIRFDENFIKKQRWLKKGPQKQLKKVEQPTAMVTPVAPVIVSEKVIVGVSLAPVAKGSFCREIRRMINSKN